MSSASPPPLAQPPGVRRGPAAATAAATATATAATATATAATAATAAAAAAAAATGAGGNGNGNGIASANTNTNTNTDTTSRASTDWSQDGERSNARAMQLMAWIAVKAGRRVARLLLHPITLYYLVCARAARRHSGRYLRRALGRPVRLSDRYRHFHAFASVVLDRIYFVRSRMGEFDLRMHGAELVDSTRAQGRGAFLLGAHIGSFEALHAAGATRPGLRVAMVMYPDNAKLIHQVLQALAPDFELGIIPIGRAGSTLQIRDWLDDGGLVGVLGDRFLPKQAAHATRDMARMASSTSIPFLGTPAVFADGPLRLAMLLRRPVIFMAGLYRGGRCYDVRFELLADFSQAAADPAARDAQVQAALHAYVARLEALVREAPYNWFNFFDYWREDT